MRRCGAAFAPVQQACNAANFNGPFVSGLVVVSMTVTRVLTSVATGSARYTASASVDGGSSFDLTVSPSTFAISAGAQVTAAITVKRRPSTKMGTTQFGQVSLSL